MESFDEMWKAMNLEEQRSLLGQMVEKVGLRQPQRQSDRQFQVRQYEEALPE